MLEALFQNFCLLSQKVQKLAQEINQKNVTPDLRIVFHHRVEKLQNLLVKLRKKGRCAALDELEEQIICLYRDIEDRFELHEMNLISAEALKLGTSMALGKKSRTQKALKDLCFTIEFLTENRMPSMKHRETINLALDLVHDAQLLCMGKAAASDQEIHDRYPSGMM